MLAMDMEGMADRDRELVGGRVWRDTGSRGVSPIDTLKG